jgi:hypothetical protein
VFSLYRYILSITDLGCFFVSLIVMFRSSGLLQLRINFWKYESWNFSVGPLDEGSEAHKNSTYMGQHKLKRNNERDSNSRSRCLKIVSVLNGCAITQAVSRWLPTAAARVWSSGICDGQSGAGAGFIRVLRFPLPIDSTKFSILTITRGRYNRPINGRRAEWTQFGLHPPLWKLKKKKGVLNRAAKFTFS